MPPIKHIPEQIARKTHHSIRHFFWQSLYLKLAERLGAQRVFEKPIQISVLLNSIAELLGDQDSV